MSVFLSWAGKQSHEVAKAFHAWLPKLIQKSSPWLSSEDIRKGSSWPDDLQSALQGADGVGLFFVTAEALKSQWMLFEAGRIASLGARRVCVVRVGLERIDPPLGLYQSVSLAKEELRQLVRDLNEVLQANVDERNLSDLFDWAWDGFAAALAAAQQTDVEAQDREAGRTAEPSIGSVLSALDRIEARIGGLEDRWATTDRMTRVAIASMASSTAGIGGVHFPTSAGGIGALAAPAFGLAGPGAVGLSTLIGSPAGIGNLGLDSASTYPGTSRPLSGLLNFGLAPPSTVSGGGPAPFSGQPSAGGGVSPKKPGG